jgi:hypothetical protein
VYSAFFSNATSTMKAAPSGWQEAVSTSYIPWPFVSDAPIRATVSIEGVETCA